LNISPGSLVDFSRVVAIRTGIRDPPSADLAAGISTPCNGRPAHEQEASAKTKAPVARSRRAVLTSLRKSQDNSQRPGTNQSMDFLSVSLSQNAVLPTNFGISIQVNGDRNEMPHDPAIKEFVWQPAEIVRSQF
jgi:hypothetical protein